ncbi:MAG: hypothetical protein N2234_05730 [Planctomycetota bacterium]|nr:hypothetical protein [Planctomycetota bacterium]
MSDSESRSFEVDLQLIGIGNEEFMIPMPVVDRSVFPTEGMQTEKTPFERTQEGEKEDSAAAPPLVEEALDVSAAPVESSFGTGESGPSENNDRSSRFQPTLVIERPKSEGLSLDMSEGTNWKVTVRKPEEKKVVQVPKKRLSKALLVVFLLFLGLCGVYWMKVEPVHSKVKSFLHHIRAFFAGETEGERTFTPPDGMIKEESDFKKKMREHLKRVLGE